LTHIVHTELSDKEGVPALDELMARAKVVDVHAVVLNPDRADAKETVAMARSRNDAVVVLAAL
jgi:hypothetical protein